METFCNETVPVIGCLNVFCRITTKFGVVLDGFGANFMSDGLTILTELFFSGGTLFAGVD